MAREIIAGETDVDLRKVYFQIVNETDGMTPETGEANGQPQISVDGGAWTDTGIGTLVSIGNGRYYAILAENQITSRRIIETRYKSANTAECPGDSIEVLSPSGDGARSVTLTIQNSTPTALQGAKVRMTKGAESFTASTNASGVASFSVDDGTWVISITLNGYSFTPTTLVVDGNETQTYTMTTIAIPESNPGQVTGYLYCYDQNGIIESGVTVNIQQTKAGTGTGYAYDSAVRTATSAVDGSVTFTNLFVGATYDIWKGTNVKAKKSFRIDSGDTSPYALDSIIG